MRSWSRLAACSITRRPTSPQRDEGGGDSRDTVEQRCEHVITSAAHTTVRIPVSSLSRPWNVPRNPRGSAIGMLAAGDREVYALERPPELSGVFASRRVARRTAGRPLAPRRTRLVSCRRGPMVGAGGQAQFRSSTKRASSAWSGSRCVSSTRAAARACCPARAGRKQACNRMATSSSSDGGPAHLKRPLMAICRRARNRGQCGRPRAWRVGSILDGFLVPPARVVGCPSLECEPHAGGNGVRLRQTRWFCSAPGTTQSTALSWIGAAAVCCPVAARALRLEGGEPTVADPAVWR